MKTAAAMEKLFETAPFSLSQREKEELLMPRFRELAAHHYRANPVFRNLVDRVFGKESLRAARPEDLPFVPARFFKTHELSSVAPDAVVKVLTSSGTAGQTPSRIHLDARTAANQAKALVKVCQHFLGSARLPMVVIDSKAAVNDRLSRTARAAGIVGMMQFGRNPFYALHDDMTLDLDGLERYVESAGGRVFYFGFTFIIWERLVRTLEGAGKCLEPHDGVLFHGGGWKKMEHEAVSPEEFRHRAGHTLGGARVHNFYGMVEQPGGVYFENEKHFMHAPVFSDVIVRDPATLKPAAPGEPGFIQVLSTLPESYPGFSVLTEDMGVLCGEDDPALDMKGRFFEVLGRVPRSEVRGCSDTFEPAGVRA